ncbi:MAG: hypothetical protein IJ841_05955 [Prevotella sp.]|nr:hypothetical protein [Prevotella sp.]
MRKDKTLQAALAALMLACLGTTAQASSWRINSDAAKKPHFADINAAMASEKVVAGDTLYLDPGTALTTEQNVTKQVTIIGCGYFLGNAPHQAATISATTNLKAAGIKVEAVDMVGIVAFADDIVIERCKTGSISRSGDAVRNLTVRQCYVANGHIIGDYSKASCTGWVVENCYVFCQQYLHVIEGLNSPIVRNNYIRLNYNNTTPKPVAAVTNGVIINNIIINQYYPNVDYLEVTNCTVSNNLLSAAEGTYSYADTHCGTTDEQVFFQMQGQNDQRFRLADDSPARGAAIDGGDCGPTGGRYPYVCSGFPLGMPYFESSTVPSRPQDGLLRVTQKVVQQAE